MSKKKTKKNSANKGLAIVLIIAVIILAAVICFLIKLETGKSPSQDSTVVRATFGTVGNDVDETLKTETNSENTTGSEPLAATETGNSEGETSTEAVQIDAVQELNNNLGYDLVISDIGSYTGVYMEDGSDEFVVGVLMLVLTNNSDLPLEYAEIELTDGNVTAKFSVSTLPAGASAVLLEQNRMSYEEDMALPDAELKHVSFFDAPLDLCEDQIQIQGLDGVMNIINVSDHKIEGDIVIYYKNSAQDMYYGGITYRVRITGGMEAGEIKQIISDHYSNSGSSVMFVTCG